MKPRLTLALALLVAFSLGLASFHPIAVAMEQLSATTCSTTNACIVAHNTADGPGIEAFSKNGTGVLGTTGVRSSIASNLGAGVTGIDRAHTKHGRGVGHVQRRIRHDRDIETGSRSWRRDGKRRLCYRGDRQRDNRWIGCDLCVRPQWCSTHRRRRCDGIILYRRRRQSFAHGLSHDVRFVQRRMRQTSPAAILRDHCRDADYRRCRRIAARRRVGIRTDRSGFWKCDRF